MILTMEQLASLKPCERAVKQYMRLGILSPDPKDLIDIEQVLLDNRVWENDKAWLIRSLWFYSNKDSHSIQKHFTWEDYSWSANVVTGCFKEIINDITEIIDEY